MSLCGLALVELQREDAHADEIRAVNALKGLDDHCAHTEQVGTFRRPVTTRACAVLFSADDDRGDAFITVAHRRLVDRSDLTRGLMLGDAALDAGH